MITRPTRALVGATCALAAAVATASAQPEPVPVDPVPVDPVPVAVDPVATGGLVVAVDPAEQAALPSPPPEPDPLVIADQPYVPPPEPYYDPPTPIAEDDGPSESVVAMASYSQGHLTGDQGLEVFGRGASLGFSFLQRDGEFPTGVEFSGVFLRGEDASVYALTSRVIGSPKIGKRALVPYVAIGLAVGASRIVTAEDKMAGRDVDYGLSIGPSAGIGLHGFLSKNIYWRAGAGVLGTGIGTFTADAGIGVVID